MSCFALFVMFDEPFDAQHYVLREQHASSFDISSCALISKSFAFASLCGG